MSTNVAQLPVPTEEDSEATKRRVLSGNFQITLQRVDQRAGTQVSLQMTGPVYTDDGMDPKKPHELHDRVDRYQAVIDRQLTLADIKQKEAIIAGELTNLDLLAKQNDDLKSKVQMGAKPSTVQKTQLANYDGQVKSRLDVIAKLQADIATAKKTIGLA